MDDILTTDLINDNAATTAPGPDSSGRTPAAPVFSVPEVPPAPPVTTLTLEPSADPAAPTPAAVPVDPAQNSASPRLPSSATSADASLNEANKLRICCKALKNIEQEIATIIRLLEVNHAASHAEAVAIENNFVSRKPDETAAVMKVMEGRVVEGVFDGQNMVGSDGKIYTVPANYASKSKLVEGDLLKLTITPKGSFIYKQIGPIERSRVIGDLGFDPTIGEFYATTDNRRWSVIKASVTYFKGEPGDEVVLLVPKNAPSKWAAVENIIKRNPLA